MTLRPGAHDFSFEGRRVAYDVLGDAGPLVLFHAGGPGMDARQCYGEMGSLPEFCQVVMLHPLGTGRSERPASKDAYRLADYARTLRGLQDHLDLPQVVVMGHSHGGMVAQYYAILHRSRVSKLILSSTAATLQNAADPQAMLERFRAEPWFEDARAAFAEEWSGQVPNDEAMAAIWEREMPMYFSRWTREAAAYRERMRPWLINNDALQCFNQAEAPTMNLLPGLLSVKCPTLILAGRHDFMATVEMAQQMHRFLVNSELVVLEHSGHMSYLEEPQAYAGAIRRFLIGAQESW